jgi:hypothetical protein
MALVFSGLSSHVLVGVGGRAEAATEADRGPHVCFLGRIAPGAATAAEWGRSATGASMSEWPTPTGSRTASLERNAHMTRLALRLSTSFLFLAFAAAQDGDFITLHEQLVAVKLPKGFQSTTQDIKAGDKIIGNMIVISQPDQVSRVIVRIELRDLTAVPARRAAVKGYVNGFAASLSDAGYKVVEKHIPDVAKESFDKPISVGAVFADSEGKKLWTHQEIFFTDKGFVVQVIAEDPDTLKSLMKWAKTVKPKARP